MCFTNITYKPNLIYVMVSKLDLTESSEGYFFTDFVQVHIRIEYWIVY
jgi:hypothetical protein